MSHNVSGQAYALTVLTPIEDGREEELTAHLDALGDGDASPLARVPGTHIARWVVIGEVKFQTGPAPPDALAPRLLFSSNFDGDARRRTWRGCGPAWPATPTRSGATAAAIPATQDAAAFAAWMRRHQLDAALFFAAYGEQTVEQVHANLAARTRPDRVRARDPRRSTPRR